MSCAPFDIRDYFFEELNPQEATQVEAHVAACQNCRLELSRLDVTRTAMEELPAEEPPRRLAFVSDKVFEPTPWQRFWNSGAKLAFGSAALLSGAILVSALTRPANIVQTSNVNYAVIEAKVREEVSRQIPLEVAKAVSLTKEVDQKNLTLALSSLEKKNDERRELDIAAMQATFEVMQRKASQGYLAAVASYEGAR